MWNTVSVQHSTKYYKINLNRWRDINERLYGSTFWRALYISFLAYLILLTDCCQCTFVILLMHRGTHIVKAIGTARLLVYRMTSDWRHRERGQSNKGCVDKLLPSGSEQSRHVTISLARTRHICACVYNRSTASTAMKA